MLNSRTTWRDSEDSQYQIREVIKTLYGEDILASHKPRSLTRKLTEQADLVLVMTVAQAAKVLGYSVQHTRLLIRKGKLHALKLGRDWAILRDDLSQYIDASKMSTRPASSRKFGKTSSES